MKHGVAFRKLSRTSSHRMLMLRNMVTSLFEHEQIKTTLPKAKEAARLAEKMISLTKKGTLPAYHRAAGFILKAEVTRKLFDKLGPRYSERPGGYTRIHKFGRRPGDNAPNAILELVDNPRDLKFEMTARAVGWDLLSDRIRKSNPQRALAEGVGGIPESIEAARIMKHEENGPIRLLTRWNLQKALKFRPSSATYVLAKKAEAHVNTLLARPLAGSMQNKMWQFQKVIEKSADDMVDSSPTARKVDTTTPDTAAPQVYFRNAKDLWRQTRAGEVTPGHETTTWRAAQGDLAFGAGRKYKWLRKAKLGINQDGQESLSAAHT
ncbi:mitochondrial ribosomal protein L17 [Vararia minispora EC-137]|uniref:Mitochondrial ribosomal protein L17 n=1 Tax=Vararia minispora EC-137 TaxID=1314806 RepID=A0ACB8QR39_9AGAM|nr:mitochondrial ribosomal protein L17 [Vararia minispora EC-137]